MTPRTLLTSLLAFLCLAFLAAPAALPQQDSPSDALLKDLPWRNIGPAIMGGRIDDFAVVESRPSTVYVATASGGLFKTVNNGTTWDPLFDDQLTSTIGDVTVAPSDPQVVWVGTGESNNRQSSSWGNGVYRSPDGGKTWSHLGLADTHHVARIVVHPKDPNTAWVAATGHLWGPNAERGVFKTTDGGKTWNRVLYVDSDTGCTDLALDLQEPDTLYAAMYSRRRTPFGFVGGGPGSGIHKTTDGGKTWQRLAGGLPQGDTGRIGLDLYRKDPKIVYAVVEHREGGVFRSEDRGETWKRMSDTNPRPMYYSQIRVDPNDDQRIWVLGVSVHVSRDGGKTFATNVVSRTHSDFHAMWIDPADSDHMIAGCDGGMQWSYDRGRTWDLVNNLPLAQFYEICFDMRRPYWVYGGLQDNGTWGAPSATLFTRGVTNDEWIRVGGGDGFYAQADPTDPNTLYVESQNGSASRLNLATGERKSIRPRPGPGEPPYRFDWDTPILISPHDPKKIFLGGNCLFVSNDRGDTWRRTEDLSTGVDRNTLPILGSVPGPGTLSRHDGQASFAQILTVSESPRQAGVIWVGTDDGNLQLSRDDGRTWKNVAGSVPGVPKGTYVSRVVASNASPGRAYATFDNHRNDDFRPYVFVTEDFGATWKPLAAELPDGATVHVLREHPRSEDLLFLGTERGAYVSLNRGGRWHRFGAPLPNVPVDDIQVHPRENDLILATHGRGIWILDDVAALEALAGRPLPEKPHLFAPRTAIPWRLTTHKAHTGHKLHVAPNPPSGALLQYWLPAKPPTGESVKLAVLETDGKTVVRELTERQPRAGLNRTTWDLRWRSLVPADPAPAAGRGRQGGGGGPGGTPGPRALPGTYLVRLTVGGVEQTQPLRVEEDPRIVLTPAEMEARFDALMTLNRLAAAAAQARRSLQDLRTQVTALQGMPAFQDAPAPLKDSLAALLQKVTTLQAAISPPTGRGGNVPPAARESGTAEPITTRLSRAVGNLESVSEPVGRDARREIDALSADLRRALWELDHLRTQTLPELNRQLAERQLPPLKPGDPVSL